MRLYALVLFYIVSGSPIEEYALKVTNCLALCNDQYTESCRSQCNLWTACSGSPVCRLRCAINDTACYRACDSFTTTPNCSTPCTSDTLTTVLPKNTLQLTTNFSSEEEHVLLLDLIYDGTHLTVNSSSISNITFQGLYPGAWYRLRAVVFSSYNECCTETGNNSRAEFVSSTETEFPLAPNLTELFSDSEMYLNKSKEPILYPKYVFHDVTGTYKSDGDLKSETNLRFRRSDLSQVSVDDMKYMSKSRPFQLGAGYIVHVYPDTDDEITLYDETYSYSWLMIPMVAHFCAFVPNRDNESVSIQPEGCVNTTTIVIAGDNVTYAEYEPDLSSIHSCFRSSEPNGSIEEVPCCGAEKGEKHIECLRGKDEKSNKALFNLNYDYFVYMNNDSEQCYAGKPCSGTFERLNTALLPQCEISTEPMIILWVLAGLCAVTVCTASLAVWYYWKDRVNRKQRPSCRQSNIHDMFDLDRAKIIKHKLIGRGNFGLVFEGKLIVSGGFDFEGETSMDDEVNVAIKILKAGDTGEDEQREAREAMRAEINLMKKLQENGRSDRNVLKMIGCVVNASPYMMILELCHVNLKVYLRNHRVEIEDQAVDAEKLATLTKSTTPEPIMEHEVLKRTATDPFSTSAARSTVLFNRYSLDRNRSTVDYMDSKRGRMTMSSPCTGSYKDEILSSKKMLDFCMQVAKGMEFLHSIDILHRDIAASNILVQITDEEVVLKICDFGQSKMLYKGEYTVANNVNSNRKMFRLRWTAPEVIANSALWSKGSDIWSYGVLMWEIFTLGGTPYPGWPDYTIQSSLTLGHRMTCPPVCSEDIFEIMSNCWSQYPGERRSFLAIKEKTENMMMDEHNAEFGIGASDYYAFPIDATVDPEKDLEEVDEADKDIDIRKVDEGSGGLLDEEFVVRASFGEKNEAGEAEIVINMNI